MNVEWDEPYIGCTYRYDKNGGKITILLCKRHFSLLRAARPHIGGQNDLIEKIKKILQLPCYPKEDGDGIQEERETHRDGPV